MIRDLKYAKGATPLDPNELAGLIPKHITTQGELDELEQANIQSGLLWLSRQKGDVLTDDFAVKLHKQLLGEVWEWAGSFRKTGKNIGIDPIQIPVELRMLMDNARYWVDHKTYSPVEAAVRFHHRLTQIHPFPNGNGRHARIMADAMLEHVYGAPAIDWAGGYDLKEMNVRREAYIVVLKAADGGDFGQLMESLGRRNNLKSHPSAREGRPVMLGW
jgi:Fic-DOC domain mobile mystery protein B